MESNEQLDEIMQCSKEAIARAYMCQTSGSECIVPINCYCPYERNEKGCRKVTPQDWQEVLDERNGGEACITE